MITLLLAFVAAIDAPIPLALDLSGVSERAIEATVLHMQSLVHQAEAAVTAAENKTTAAKAENVVIRQKMDALVVHDKMETRFKWRWFAAFAGSVLINIGLIVLWLRK